MLKRIFTFLLLVIHSSGSKYVPCESVAVGTRGWFTCSMEVATVIAAPDHKISTPRDERVQEILFNRNRKICFLPLDISKNFPNLTGYSARNCSIRNVRKENFQNLNALKGIYLDNNQIETIFSETFEGLTSLMEIFLGQNKIKQLNGKLFAGLSNLKQVRLEMNYCINENFIGNQCKINTMTQIVTMKCGFAEEAQLIANKNLQIQNLQAELLSFENELQLSKAAQGQCDLLSRKMNSESAFKSATIARLETELKAAQDAQSSCSDGNVIPEENIDVRGSFV